MDEIINTGSPTKVILLGTGNPNADPQRSGPSVAVVVDNIPYIVDCGPGVVRRAAAAGLDMRNLKRLFITHLHSDHTTGYPDLIFTPWVLERREPLEVYGPFGTKEMTEHILAAYEQDIRVRINGPEHANDDGWRVNVREVETGEAETGKTGESIEVREIYRDSRVKVEAFPVEHCGMPAFGFRFTTSDRTIVISGDTAPTRTVIDMARGCDILVHEVYSAHGFAGRPPSWQKYHSSVHTSTTELAAIASEAKPGLLVFYHQLSWGGTEEDLVAEVRQGYIGKIVSGRDLDVF